jgi:hypothetical protein
LTFLKLSTVELQKVNKLRGNFPENFEWSKQPF